MSKYENIYDPEESPSLDKSDPDSNLIGFILARVEPWLDYTQTNYFDKWDEYYRLFRGVFSMKDKTRSVERSKIISPALQQAIEATVSEQEEATFGRKIWFDLDDDVSDQEKDGYTRIRDQLMEDLNYTNVPGAIAEIYLNGALYGTGIGKLIVEERTEIELEAPSDENILFGTMPKATEKERFCVRLEAVDPREFAIDPCARTIDESLGVAHVTFRPVYEIERKQKAGIYKDVEIGSSGLKPSYGDRGELTSPQDSDLVRLVEWHGKVPKKFIKPEETTGIMSSIVPATHDDSDDGEYVEAIVTIANDSVVLKAVETPYLMRDRSFIAYQHDTIPNRFWGRGIAEKGYNPQKALDAELRARMDTLALTVYPMIAGDITRMPRGMKLRAEPGKEIYTHGDPRTVLMPFTLGNLDPNSFRNTGDLERMVQMGTGAMDSATPVGISPRNDTASGMSMMLSGSIKRNKRTMQNIDRNLLTPLLKKALWRFIQFDYERYPINDYRFVVTSTMGIMARELEQQQLISLVSTVPPESPAFWVLLRSIYENSSISNKDEMLEYVEQMLENAKNPPPPPEPKPDFKDQIAAKRDEMTHQREMLRLQVEKQRADQEGDKVAAQVYSEQLKQSLEESKAVIAALEAQSKAAKMEAERVLTLTKAEAELISTKMAEYETLFKALEYQMQDELHEVRKGISEVSEQSKTNTANMQKMHKKMSASMAMAIRDLENMILSREGSSGEELEEFNEKIKELEETVKAHEENEGTMDEMKIERDQNGLIVSINGKPVERDQNGLIMGIG